MVTFHVYVDDIFVENYNYIDSDKSKRKTFTVNCILFDQVVKDNTS
jgi:hypothetical protein